MGREILSYVDKHHARHVPLAARFFVVCFGALMAAGFLLGLSEVRASLPISSPLWGRFSGAVHVWLFTSTGAYFIFAALRFLYRRTTVTVKDHFDPGRRRLLQAASGAMIASPFVVVGYGALIERTDFRVREVDVSIAGLPDDLQGLKLLLLSDIHLSPFLSEKELERVIGMANENRPHIALVTGDLISSRGDPLNACLRQVSRLRSDAGIFGCLGNHEHYAGVENYATAQGARLGIRFLRSQATQFRFGSGILNCAGVDYQRMGDRKKYLVGAERLVVPGAVNVLLSHNPDVFPAAAKKGYDLTLSGHTHGGQVTVEIFDQSVNPARFFTPYVYGLYRTSRNGTAVPGYVTRGIGTIGIPARIGAPPEIAVLRLRKA